jgi:hypothetical protein
MGLFSKQNADRPTRDWEDGIRRQEELVRRVEAAGVRPEAIAQERDLLGRLQSGLQAAQDRDASYRAQIDAAIRDLQQDN